MCVLHDRVSIGKQKQSRLSERERKTDPCSVSHPRPLLFSLPPPDPPWGLPRPSDPVFLSNDPSAECRRPLAGSDGPRELSWSFSGLPGLAFSRPKNKFGLFKKLVGLEILENLLSSLPGFKSIKPRIY